MSLAYPLFVLQGDLLEHLDLLLVVLDLHLEVRVVFLFGLLGLLHLLLLLVALVLRVGLVFGLLVLALLRGRLLVVFVEVGDFEVLRDDELLQELYLAVKLLHFLVRAVQLARELCDGHLSVDLGHVLDLLGPLSEPQRADGFLQVELGRRAGDDQGGLRVASDGVLEHPGQD